MNKDLFKRKYGTIVALDVENEDNMRAIVDVCNEVEGVEALKLGFTAGLILGIPKATRILRQITKLPIIYDHQKMGVNPPKPPGEEADAIWDAMFGGRGGVEEGEFFGQLLGSAGIDAGIVYPVGDFFYGVDSGSAVMKSFVRNMCKNNVEPFVLGRFTMNAHLRSEGGLYPNDAPRKIYGRAAAMGVKYYIMPGNRPDEVGRYVDIVTSVLPADVHPSVALPGFGTQGGEITKAFRSTNGLPSYAIIGPCDCFDITDRSGLRDLISRYSDEALSFC